MSSSINKHEKLVGENTANCMFFFFFFSCRCPDNWIFRLFSNIILSITLSVSLTSSKHTCQLFPLPTFKSVTSVYRQTHEPVLHLLSGILCVVIEGLADLRQNPCAAFLYCTLWVGASDARVCGPLRARRQPTSPEHNNGSGPDVGALSPVLLTPTYFIRS